MRARIEGLGAGRLMESAAWLDVQSSAVADGVAFLKVCDGEGTTGGMFEAFAADAVVDEEATFIPVEIIVQDAAAVKGTGAVAGHGIAVLVAAHTEEWIAEVIVADEDEEIGAESEIKIHTIAGAMPEPSAVHEDGAGW